MQLLFRIIATHDPAVIWFRLHQGLPVTRQEALILEQALNSHLPKHTAALLGKEELWGDDLDDARALIRPILKDPPQ